MTDDNKNPLDPLTDGLIDTIAFTTDPKKVMVKTTRSAYLKATLAGAAKFIPALALLTGGEAISQETPVRKPDEHLASSSQPSNAVQEGRNQFVVSVTSTAFSSSNGLEKVHGSEGVVYVIKKPSDDK